jgi:hypothetical protein
MILSVMLLYGADFSHGLSLLWALVASTATLPVGETEGSKGKATAGEGHRPPAGAADGGFGSPEGAKIGPKAVHPSARKGSKKPLPVGRRWRKPQGPVPCPAANVAALRQGSPPAETLFRLHLEARPAGGPRSLRVSDLT